MLHRSPGLTAIYNEIKNSKRNRILDLGSLVASNFTFLSALSCKIHFENMDEFVEEKAKLSAGNIIYSLNKFLLSHKPEQKFDVILAWDLLNYLPLDVVEALFSKLSPWCQPNTLVHSIRYLNGAIPCQPARFEIIDQYHIQIHAPARAPRRVNLHNTAAFLKKVPQYYLHNNLMNEAGMASGIGEQVLRFMPDKSRRKQYVASTEITQSISENIPLRASATANNGTQLSYKSPAIEQLLTQTLRRKCILDLGRKSPHNMEIWRRHFREVYSEDLASSIRWHTNTSDLLTQANEHSLSKQALNFDRDQQFDAIVLWDILNYCNRNQLRAIGERLKPHCRANTRFIVFSYLGGSIPPQPQKFMLHEKGEYKLEELAKQARVQEAISTSGIMKLVPNWRITQTHIFSQGMRPGLVELVFEFNEQQADIPLKEQRY